MHGKCPCWTHVHRVCMVSRQLGEAALDLLMTNCLRLTILLCQVWLAAKPNCQPGSNTQPSNQWGQEDEAEGFHQIGRTCFCRRGSRAWYLLAVLGPGHCGRPKETRGMGIGAGRAASRVAIDPHPCGAAR